jgi:hypothetical protein
VNATATSYTVDQAFAALEALKVAKDRVDSISGYCPDRSISQAYHAAGVYLVEIADYFFAKLTGFTSLSDCLSAQSHGYRPTFREEGGKDRETVFLAEVYDYIAECRGLPLRAYRPQRAKPVALTLQSLKAKLKHLRGEARRDTKSIDARFFRSSGTEVRFGGDADVDYCFVGEWNGTLKQLKSLAEECRSRGGKIVSLSGHWKCGDNLEDIFDPTDCEWEVNLTPDEILAIGKKS